MDSLKISVIIATYNTAEYIEECLDSIVSQTLQQIEIIIIDDGSTDNTQEILKKYVARYSNISVYYQENMGAGLARNKGIGLANGEYMIFMDPDDKYPTNECLEILYNTAKSNDVLICGGNVLGNDNGKIIEIYSAGSGINNSKKNSIVQIKEYFYLYNHQRYIFKSDFMKKENIIYAPYKRYEDQVLTINALGKAGRFYELDYPVYEYRINYKSNKYDKNTYLDMFKGFRDTLKLICYYGMKLMYEKNCQNFINGFMPQISRFVHKNDKDFNQVIEDTNDIIRSSGWSSESDLITQERVEQNIKNYQNMQKKLDAICKSNRKIIIYGAGKNTKKFLKCYEKKIKNIIGIAVTEKNDIDTLEGIEVHIIKEYLSFKDEALVLVTPSSKVKDSIFSVLNELGFKRYEWIDVNLI